MGWASGGEIFDTVAQGLIDAKASDEIKTSVLDTLYEALTAEDWDTTNESYEQFKDDPAIRTLFHEKEPELK
jgi:hypothetical protein